MGWLLSIYIAATVFGVGVTAIDLLGLIGDHGSEGDSGHAGGHDGDSGHDGGDDVGHIDYDDGGADLGGHDDGDVGHVDYDDGAADHVIATHDGGDHSDESEVADHASVAGHDTRRRNPILRILSALRNLVYFSLGFGPTGWFAIATGQGTVPALLWSGGVGLVVLVGARGLRRVLRSELSSDITESDLLMERGTVTVTIEPKQLGRVRIRVGGALVDRYARSHSDKAIEPGTEIRVIDITDECVYIEPEEE